MTQDDVITQFQDHLADKGRSAGALRAYRTDLGIFHFSDLPKTDDQGC